MPSETPSLCKYCQQWLVVSPDRFCANCGVALVTIKIAPERLQFTNTETINSLKIYNLGEYSLYWTAEVTMTVLSRAREFLIMPSYGIVRPNTQQTISVTWQAAADWPQAQLLISSNAPESPEIVVALDFSML